MISDLGCIFDKDFLSVLSNVGDLCLTWARTDLIEMKIQGVSFGYRPHEPLGLQRNLNRRAGLGCIFHGSADASIFLSRVHISGSCWRMWGFCMYRWAKLKLGKRNFGRDSVEGTLDWLSLSLSRVTLSLCTSCLAILRHKPPWTKMPPIVFSRDIWWILFHSKTLLVSKTLRKESWPKESMKRPRQIFLQNRILSCNMYLSKFMDWTCDCIVPKYVICTYIYII